MTTTPPTTLEAALAEIERLRIERDKILAACIHDLSPAGYAEWAWIVGIQTGRTKTKEDAIAAVRKAVGV